MSRTKAMDIPFDFKNQKQITYETADILKLSNDLGEILDSLLNNSTG